MFTVAVVSLVLICFASVVNADDSQLQNKVVPAVVVAPPSDEEEIINDGESPLLPLDQDGQFAGPLSNFRFLSDPASNDLNRHYGGMANRVETSQLDSGVLVPYSADSGNGLRAILRNRQQGTISKEKRKPHFGFHGSRG